MAGNKMHRRKPPSVPPPPLLLSYALSTDPSPLQPGETGAVILTVTPIAAPVYSDRIILSVKVGSDSDCLFEATPSAAATPTGWSHNPAKAVPGANAGAPAKVIFSTDDPGLYEIDYPFTLTLQGQVGTAPGSFPIAIVETAGTTNNEFTTNQGSVTVSTNSANFYLENFVATAAGKPDQPCTEFPNGPPASPTQVTLSWGSNGSSYALWRKGESKAFWNSSASPPETTHTFDGPATDTTYFLVATSSGNPPTLYDALTITISNPDLTPNSVTTAGPMSSATLTVGAPGGKFSTAATVTGGLGTDTLTSGTTTVGTAGANASLTVNGAATVTAGASIAGGASLTGNVVLCGNGAAAAYPAALDVQNGWTRIGCFNTQILPPVSDLGGMVVGWNRSNGSAEVNLFNVFNYARMPAQMSFVFTQLLPGGLYIDLLSVSSTGTNISGNAIITGSVGVGTSSPLAPLHVAAIQASVAGNIRDQYLTLSTYQWNSSSSNTWNPPQLSDRGQTLFPNTSILANGQIVAPSFIAFSDQRMKNVKGRSNGFDDLEKLLKIEVTDYTHIDPITGGTGVQKKLLGQQVEAIFPEATATSAGIIPDIFRRAEVAGDWLVVETNLKAGERVRLLSEGVDAVYEVLEATPEGFRTELSPSGKPVFVFGREIEDLRMIDYTAIAMLHVSATQQIKRETDETLLSLRAEVAELRAALAGLRKQDGGNRC